MKESNKYRVIYFSRYLAESVFYSFLTIFLKDSGINGSRVGALLSFSPLLLALSLPLWLKFDNARSRKALVITAAVLFFVMEIVLNFTASFALLIPIMVIFSVVRAPMSPSLDSMTTVYCIEHKREFSVFRAWGSAGYIAAIMLGGYMYGKVDFIWLIAVSGVFFAVFIAVSLFVKPLELDKEVKKKEHDLNLLFRNKAFWVFLIAQILCFATMNLNNSYDILYLQSRGVNTALFGITTLIRVSCEILTFAFLRRVKLNYKLLFCLVPLMMVVQSVVYFVKAPVFTLFLVVIITGMASGIIIFLNNKYISLIVRPINVTAATYITVTVQNLALALFLFLGGLVIDYLGINYLYLLTGVMFIAGAVFVFLFFKGQTTGNTVRKPQEKRLPIDHKMAA